MTQREERKSFFLKTTVSGNPDAYALPGAFNQLPKYSFGKSVRDEALPRGPPGPGAYNYINQVGNANDCDLINASQRY